AFETGLAFLPTTLMIGVMSSGVAARLMLRVGPRSLLAVGLSTIIAALALLASGGPGVTYAPWLLTAYVLLGAGGGMSFLPLLTITMADVPIADSGLASGISNVTMQVGASLGLAAMAAMSTGYTNSLVAQGTPGLTAVAGANLNASGTAAAMVAAGLRVAAGCLRPSAARARG